MLYEILFSSYLDHNEGPVIKIDELAEICPEEFRQDNPWTKFVSQLFGKKVNLDIWPWKAKNENIIKHQLNCLDEVFDSSHSNKFAIAGWMLSEMLESVPENIVATSKQ